MIELKILQNTNIVMHSVLVIVEEDIPVEIPRPTKIPIPTALPPPSGKLSPSSENNWIPAAKNMKSSKDPAVARNRKPMSSVDSQSERSVPALRGNETTTPVPAVVDTYRGVRKLNEGRIGMIIGVLTALILLLIAIIVVIVIRHRRHKLNSHHRAMKIVAAHHQNVSGDFR